MTKPAGKGGGGSDCYHLAYSPILLVKPSYHHRGLLISSATCNTYYISRLCSEILNWYYLQRNCRTGAERICCLFAFMKGPSLGNSLSVSTQKRTKQRVHSGLTSCQEQHDAQHQQPDAGARLRPRQHDPPLVWFDRGGKRSGIGCKVLDLPESGRMRMGKEPPASTSGTPTR